MVSWSEFALKAPDIAAHGAQLLVAGTNRSPDAPAWFGIGFLATVRRDGAPRLAPVCPIMTNGKLFIAAVPPKRHDLERNGHYVLHAFLGPDDAEFALRGRATPVSDPVLMQSVKDTVAGTGMLADPASREALFELSIEQAHAAVWIDVGKPGTYAEKRTWRPE